ncbi:endoplasmic reticulum aminopeptidase 2 [Rhinatrema bivittatum]|uniref:endoplasmic reticulum aminopeptidase 2 n=1 Tax=Rhinatrema bivittatum TaxID=194408 RepID=UPI0011279995|nr:endoplasmic reticulum aminopeptidase 2 [Rhinatrema bivittatum]XP_029428725.1 endoplasmic reticulum aminopeptidase 2 [Rhinatrema bivittatum]XP_029428735.1 endoplasmic reticulum aminopeptidase 2 [Rhinatrema bivittatum]
MFKMISTRLHLLVIMTLFLGIVSYTESNNHFTGDKNDVFLATNGQPFPWNKVRLPNWIVPIHYQILIHPNLSTFTFTGSTTIEISVIHETSSIVLHSKQLEISQATIGEESEHMQTNINQLKILEYLPHEQVAFFSAKPLMTDKKYFINIAYAAKLSDGLLGFYKSTYRTKEGQERVLAATHFQPTSARQAFPCFDEPSFKANYSVKIRRDDHHIALSNMPKVNTVILENNILEDHFAASVKMSTYLVAFIICDFRFVSGTTSSGIKVSVYTVADKINQAQYALEVAIKILEYYEQYFDIPYPLPKQDLVAVPDSYAAAMENWGLIIFREADLLYDLETSSVFDKLWVSKTIGHELAHQWFGNLVTLEWWNDLWLNEGFAKYMEYMSVDATYPELQVNDDFLDICFQAMGSDANNFSQPISSKVENSAEIYEKFDVISYYKGACLLHMLRNFLTDEVFRNGIIHYLKKYSYRNVKHEDLWNSFTDCPQYCYPGEHFNVSEIMHTWIVQKGFPLIIVQQNGSTMRIRQEHFLEVVLPDESLWASMQMSYLWYVPLIYISSNSKTVGRHLLKNQSDTIELDKEPNWIKFNVDMNGYYIVHYEGNGWDNIIEVLEHNPTLFSDKDRTSLIHNVFQLARTGKLPLDRALDLIKYLKHETSNVPLREGLNYLKAFYLFMEERNISDIAENLKRYILQHFQKLIDRQIWSNEGSVSDRRMHSVILALAYDLRYPPIILKATKMFNSWMKSPETSIPVDIMEIVFSVGAQTDVGWNFLLENYKESLSNAKQIRIISALTRTRDMAKLSRLLELGMEGHIIKTQYLPSIIKHIGYNPAAQSLVWNFVKKNWPKMMEKFPLGSQSLHTIITGSLSQFSPKEKLEEVKLFFESIKDQASQLHDTQTALENIKRKIIWLEKNIATLRQWLLDNLKE